MPEPSPFDDGELYDILFTGLTYGIDFYVGLAQQARGPILDVCCGTGRILLPCLEAGADGDGLDLYEGMLNTCRHKAQARGLSPNLYQADMAQFQLPRRYALVMITFNAFIHNLTQEAQISCLTSCREHLLPGGLLAFDTFFPAPGIITASQNTRVLELETRDPRNGHMLRVYDARGFNHVEQIQTSINEIESVDAHGQVQIIHRSQFQTRYLYKHEMALLLRLAGFSQWEILGGFDGRPLTQETDSMIVLARA